MISKKFLFHQILKSFQCAFEHCCNLAEVQIPTDSILQIIESNAFAGSIINEIFIPSKVSKIGEFAFSFCFCLKKVEFAANSNLQTIESFTFYHSNIEGFFIPPNVYIYYNILLSLNVTLIW